VEHLDAVHQLDPALALAEAVTAQPGGQAMIWYCLDARAAAELHRLSNNALKPVIPESRRLTSRCP